ncbi:Gfo/Idh/MocA family protein [Metabacillus sp. RGM 3146]|uniref:Gfo/Idh/MocA family protein n=1 Tax=Metabacillus sp. RGM 3146 TaxID=3401092 RepID=UPI003B9C6505
MIRFGIVGTNWITEKLLDAAQHVEQFELSCIYSRTKERAEEFAEKYHVNSIYTELEEMAKSPELDAVYIASPNSFHADQAKLFMENGKHVLCEKPIASNTYEVKDMINTARKNGVLLMEAMKSTFHPTFLSVKENLHKIGKVRRFIGSYSQYSSRYDAYKEGTVLNAFKPELSNGALMDIGVYCLYPAIALFGKPNRIKADGMLLETGADGEGSIILGYEELDAVAMYSKIADSNLPSEIQGENGSITIDRISSPFKAVIHYRDGRMEDISVPQMENTMVYEAREFVRLIQEGQLESSINTHELSVSVMETMDEARKQMGIFYPSDKI